MCVSLEYASVGYMAKRIQMRKNRFLALQKMAEQKKNEALSAAAALGDGGPDHHGLPKQTVREGKRGEKNSKKGNCLVPQTVTNVMKSGNSFLNVILLRGLLDPIRPSLVAPVSVLSFPVHEFTPFPQPLSLSICVSLPRFHYPLNPFLEYSIFSMCELLPFYYTVRNTLKHVRIV